MKDFVATRPRRPRSGRVVAGVAAGIGRRYGIDPVIVRVALVVGAIYGGAGVICLPARLAAAGRGGGRGVGGRGAARQGAQQHVEGADGRAVRRPDPGGQLRVRRPLQHGRAGPACCWARPCSCCTGTGATSARSTRHREDHSTDPQAMTDDTTATPGRPTSCTADAAPTDAVPADAVPPNTPPAWDPLGAAPFAWDLPEPAPAAPIRRPCRTRQASQATARHGHPRRAVRDGGRAGRLRNRPRGWLTAGHIIGILAAIAGVGLVAGAFAHAGRGLIPLAAILCGGGVRPDDDALHGWHGAGDDALRPADLASSAAAVPAVDR